MQGSMTIKKTIVMTAIIFLDIKNNFRARTMSVRQAPTYIGSALLTIDLPYLLLIPQHFLFHCDVIPNRSRCSTAIHTFFQT